MRHGGTIVRRRVIEGLILAAAAAWAIQLLVGHAAHGQALAPTMGEERFVPDAQWTSPAMIELKSEAKVIGGEVKLKQLVRWGDVDRALIDQTGELVVARMERGSHTQNVGLDQIKRTLEGAGVNLGLVRFGGAAECRVTWSDPRLETALRQAVGAMADRIPPPDRFAPAAGPTTRQVFASSPTLTASGSFDQNTGTRSLREILLADLVQRLNLPAESFSVRFAPQDERLVNLAEPFFRFEVQCRNSKGIGDLTWDVNIISDRGSQKVAITAAVSVWQTQLIAARPMSYRQIIGAEDVQEKRVLVDQFREGSPISKDQVVGQQASQDINAGAVVSPRMVEPLQVVKAGQLMTITVEYGSVTIKWVAEAREPGAVGQTVRVRKVKGDLKDEFNVTVTGPQEGKLVASATKLAAR